MWTGTRRTVSIMAAMVAAAALVSAACAAPQPPSHRPAAGPKVAGPKVAGPRVARSHSPKFRPARGAAAVDAKRIGAMVGKECTGRADMPRNEHQWVVLCSNGKTFVVEPSTPPVECSLAGTGPEPACFP